MNCGMWPAPRLFPAPSSLALDEHSDCRHRQTPHARPAPAASQDAQGVGIKFEWVFGKCGHGLLDVAERASPLKVGGPGVGRRRPLGAVTRVVWTVCLGFALVFVVVVIRACPALACSTNLHGLAFESWVQHFLIKAASADPARGVQPDRPQRESYRFPKDSYG